MIRRFLRKIQLCDTLVPFFSKKGKYNERTNMKQSEMSRTMMEDNQVDLDYVGGLRNKEFSILSYPHERLRPSLVSLELRLRWSTKG